MSLLKQKDRREQKRKFAATCGGTLFTLSISHKLTWWLVAMCGGTWMVDFEYISLKKDNN